VAVSGPAPQKRDSPLLGWLCARADVTSTGVADGCHRRQGGAGAGAGNPGRVRESWVSALPDRAAGGYCDGTGQRGVPASSVAPSEGHCFHMPMTRGCRAFDSAVKLAAQPSSGPGSETPLYECHSRDLGDKAVHLSLKCLCGHPHVTDNRPLALRMRQAETSYATSSRLRCIARSPSGCLLPVHGRFAHG